ncbi:MAG: hypothetical protein O2897_04285 [bacterium]|nr:hypothetical protein [bacterium]
MKYLTLAFIVAFLSILNLSCGNNTNCVRKNSENSFYYIPNNPNLDCTNTPLTKPHEQIQCLHGGNVIVTTSDGSTKISPEKVVELAANLDFIPSSGGSHDDQARQNNLYEGEQSLASIPGKESDWLKYDKKINYGPNGCGIWATAVCDRVLGLENGPLTQKEWDNTYKNLGSVNGVTPFYLIANYYQNLGFCSETKAIKGFPEEYQEMKDKIDRGCDLKLFFARKNNFWFSPWAYPHIETIIEVQIPKFGPPVAITNSWGYPATVSGGTCTEFSHERNRAFAGDGENFAWPPNDARVWLQSTCSCENDPNVEKTLASIK